ncbi:MAG TPA: PAS domain S-box protein [Gaiellaceae bacterium]|nr:PAS domain S-box protein [Gaiellaceae bacterium]
MSVLALIPKNGARLGLALRRPAQSERRSGFAVVSLLLALQLCVYAAWQLLRFNLFSLSRPLMGDLFFVPLTALAVWSAWRASRRCLAGSRLRRSWLLIAVAWASWAAGNATQSVYEAMGMSAFPSVADVFYLLFVPLALAGLLSFPSVVRDREEQVRYWLDLAVVALAGAAVIFYVVLSGAATAEAGRLLKAVSIAYPVGDLLILLGVASLVLRGTVPSARRALVLLGIAAVMYVVSGVVYGYVSVHGGYQGGDPVDGFYMVAVSLFVLAAAAQERPVEGEQVVDPNARGNWLLLVSAAAGLATLAYAGHRDRFFPTYAVDLMVIGMAGLVFLRQVVARRDLVRALVRTEAANERVRSAFERAAIGMSLAAPGGTMLAANPAYAKMLGYSPSEIVGMPLSDLIHSGDRAAVAAGHRRMCSTLGTRTEGEYRYLRKDGEVIVGRVTVSPIHAEDGSLLHLLAEVEDVTELRRVEAKLGESHALQEAVIEVSNDVLSVLESDGTIRLISHSVEQKLGYSQRELVGHNFLTVVHPDDRQAALDTVAAAMRGERPAAVRCRVFAKDGSERLWDATVAAEPTTGRAPSFLVANLRDVTDQVALEDQFRQAQKMETVGRLAGGVAHDFNNLLTGIRGYNELALLKIGDGPGAAEIGGSIAAAEKAANLTAQLLAYSRRQVLDPTVFDLRDVVVELSGLLQRTINGTIELVTTLPAEPVAIRADRSQIEQVLMNLAVNAADAMASGGRLTIEVAGDEARHEARMLVHDNGVGMDDATRAQIFEPFFSTKGVAGTGLGLSIVDGVVKQSGGQIAAASELGEGTTFVVTLPLARNDQMPGRVGTSPAEVARHGETILLVEDDPIVRDVVFGMLTERGYSILVAADGEEAVAIAQAASPGTVDLIVTDLIMPGLDGRQTAAAVRERQPQARVLYISGYTDDEAVKAGGYEPGIAFLQKPFGIDELDEKIRELLDAVSSAQR